MDNCRRGVFNNYILLDGICKECPNGTYGNNCSVPCPLGYHGRHCLLECNCSLGQFCHPTHGCGVLMIDGTFYTTGRKTNNAEVPCHVAVAFSVSLCFGIFLFLILIYITCCQKGRCNIRDALRRKLDNIVSEVFVVIEQRRQEQAAPEAGENHTTYQGNAYADIDSPDRGSTNNNGYLSMEPMTLPQAQLNLTYSISTEFISPEGKLGDKSEDNKFKTKENEENEDDPIDSSVLSSKTKASETEDGRDINERSETVVNDETSTKTDKYFISRSEDNKEVQKETLS